VKKGEEMKEIKKIGWVCWFIVLFFILAPSTGHADLGDILSRFQPYIDFREEYSNNINLDPNNEKTDFITTVSPGIKFSTAPRSVTTGQLRETPTAEDRFRLDLDFQTGFVFYGKEEENNYIHLDGTLNALYSLTQNITFRVRDYLSQSDEIREADYAQTAIEGEYLLSRTIRRAPYLRNVFEPSAEYRFGRENIIAINYRNNLYRVQSRILEDSTENFINPRLIYWFDIRNGVSFEYGLTLGNFQQRPDLVGHMAAGRYTYRFNPQTSIFGEYNYLKRDFETPSIDYGIHRPSLGIEHNLSPTLSARVQLGYYWANFTRGPTTTNPFYRIMLTQIARRTTYTLLFHGGYLEDLFDAENLGFTKYHRVVGRISHELLQKMNVGLFGSYEWAKFFRATIETREVDRIWAAGGNVSYQPLRWLDLSLEVSYRENHSNISSSNYSEIHGIFRITATLI